MLPVKTEAHMAELAGKNMRRTAAMQACAELECWVGNGHPELKRPVGNLPRLWAALAMKDALDEHVRLARLAGQHPQQERDAQSQIDDRNRLTALERFYNQYKANLNASAKPA